MNIDNYMLGSGEIPLAVVLQALGSQSIDEKAKARELLAYGWSRIDPSPDIDEIAEPLVDYFAECVRNEAIRDATSFVHSRFEAAKELQRFLELWAHSDNVHMVEKLQYLINAVTDLFRQGNLSVRNVIETGFLEHVFEVQKNRVLFSHWKLPPFQDAFLACEKWGNSHPRNEILDSINDHFDNKN